MCVRYVCASGEDCAYIRTCLFVQVRGHMRVSSLGGYIPGFLRQGGSLDWNSTLRLTACAESPRDLSESFLPVLEVQTPATAIVFRVSTEDRMPIDPDALKVTGWAVSWRPTTTSAMRQFTGSERKERYFPGCLHCALTGSCIYLYLKEPENKFIIAS